MARWSDRSEKSLSQLFAEEYTLAHLACVLTDALPVTDKVRDEVAHAARVPPRTVRALLHADTDIGLRDLARLAHALGLRVRFSLESVGGTEGNRNTCPAQNGASAGSSPAFPTAIMNDKEEG